MCADVPGNRFASLDFEKFRALAKEPHLSRYERIGFPDAYRQGYEEAIFADICRKLPALTKQNQVILDIGPGCSDLPQFIIECCREKSHNLVLIDSAEMLNHLPLDDFIRRISGLFPACMPEMADLKERVDAIVCYSVLHYIFVDTNLFNFLDQALSLLAPGGWMLVGDIPNVSMRKRFFSSAEGISCHQKFTGKDEHPEVLFNQLEPGTIDDSVMIALVSRARSAGYHAYIVPQSHDLPMANRREDIIIQRP